MTSGYRTSLAGINEPGRPRMRPTEAPRLGADPWRHPRQRAHLPIAVTSLVATVERPSR